MLRRSIAATGIILLVGVLTSTSSAEPKADAGLPAPICPPLRITIQREHANGLCMTGYIAINGEIRGYTLERPDVNNISDISAIPEATYSGSVVLHTNADGSQQWRIGLDVRGRPGAEIHIGNSTGQTTGCVLPGTRVIPDQCAVYDSGSVMKRLEADFLAGATGVCANRQIVVEVRGTPASSGGVLACRDMTPCVTLTTRPSTLCKKNGIDVWLENRCNATVQCNLFMTKYGRRSIVSGTTVKQGQKTGGQWGGLFFCDPGDQLGYKCAQADDSPSCVAKE